MEKEIPHSAPIMDKEKILKPLEISSNSSSKSKINNNIFNAEIINNLKNNEENIDIQEIEKNFSHTIINSKEKNLKKKNLKLNIHNINAGINVNIVEGVIPNKNKKKNKNVETQQMPRTSPYNFKYFCNTANKKSINQAISSKHLHIENKELESNFIKLSKEANIYTSNAEYITNKKMLLFDKYDFENNKYKPNRAKLFDMTAIPKIKNIVCNTLYKTTKFRGGKMFFYPNDSRPKILDHIIQEDNDIKKKKPLYLIDIEKSQEKMNEKILKKEHSAKYVDNTFQKHKRHPPSNSLYKELMNKKNEIYDNYMNKIGIGDQDAPEQNFHPHIAFPAGVEEEKMKKNKNENLNGFTGLLSKKKNDGLIPITYPLICSNMLNCDSMSQRARYENIMETFTRLKSMIENDKNFGKLNEKQYIIDFISNKNIEKKFITEKNIDNFQNFLECKIMPIDISKSLKDNILKALNYNSEENIISEKEDEKTDNKQKMITKEKKSLWSKPKLILNDALIFNNNKPLEYDIPRQKKLLSDGNYKSAYELRDSLKKELESIENEVENKQKKINKIEQNLNLLPFESDYFYKQNLKAKKNKKEIKKDLRLISVKEFNKMNLEQDIKNRRINNKNNLFDFNERLYYSWYKNKNIGDIQHYKKQIKLTEYIIYNRTHEKILDKKIEEIAEQKGLQMKKAMMTK